MRKKLINILIGISLLAVGVCGVLVYMNYRENTNANAMQNEMPAMKPPVSNANEDGELSADMPLMDFSGLKTENPDILAWLTIPGTVIDYPIVQSTDNSYYLEHDVKKRKNKNGTIFLDYRNNADFSDFNSILHGHHMKSGQMFQNLVKFKDEDFFDNHTTAILYTPAKTYALEIVAVAVVPQNSVLYTYAFASPAEKETHLSEIINSAKFIRETDMTVNDRLITMSTCSYEFKDARTIVIARIR